MKNELKNATHTFIMKHKTSNEEKIEIEKNFKQFDKNRDGFITKDELKEGYIKIFGM